MYRCRNGLPHPLAQLDQALRAVFGDLLERLSATDRLHGDLGLETRCWLGRRLLMGGSPFQGRCPALQMDDGSC